MTTTINERAPEKAFQLLTDEKVYICLVKSMEGFKEAFGAFCNGLPYTPSPETYPHGYPSIVSFSWKSDSACEYIHIRCWEFEKDDFYILLAP